MPVTILLIALAGIFNGLRDMFRDFPDVLRVEILGLPSSPPDNALLKWLYRTPSDRRSVALYGKFWLTDRVIEWFNDPWHFLKFSETVLLFAILPSLSTPLDALKMLLLYGICFDLTYHAITYRLKLKELWRKLTSRSKKNT